MSCFICKRRNTISFNEQRSSQALVLPTYRDNLDMTKWWSQRLPADRSWMEKTDYYDHMKEMDMRCVSQPRWKLYNQRHRTKPPELWMLADVTNLQSDPPGPQLRQEFMTSRSWSSLQTHCLPQVRPHVQRKNVFLLQSLVVTNQLTINLPLSVDSLPK